MTRPWWKVLLGALALAVVLVPGAQAAEPFGALTPLAGPAGCVERGDGSDGCTPGRGLNQVHSVAISPDGRFLYSAAGSIAKAPGSGGPIAVFAVHRPT